MKRILINATHAEEIRVALCKGNHLYDFDLENRTREQKKANIYKGHVTRVEQSLEAVFVEYGSERQGFLPIREIAQQYLKGNPRDENIRNLIKEGDTLIVQVEKEERGNKGAALSTYVSLAGRYLVLMPNNPRGGGISRQISGKMREDMKQLLSNLEMPKNMSVIIRTAGIGKSLEDLQHDLNHLLSIWQSIQEQNERYASPRLVHQEAGVVTRAVRDYLRDDIGEIWIDNENAYHEAANFIAAVMPTQSDKLRKYTDYEPMFARFGIEKQIETAYQREVRLPSGGSIVIDQTEAMVSIDINSAKSTKGSDVAETAYHTNLEAADEIARQLRLRDMGGLIVIDFIDMNEREHQKDVEKRLVEACRYDKARVQFGEISKFGLMEMSRQRLRPSLEESTGYICPRCHGNGMIRDLRSLSLSIMRQIEQTALKERQGEVQAEVPTDIAAFLLNEKRESLVYLEQDSGTRITILPHAHMESPNYKIHFNRDGFAPSSYERVTDSQQQESHDRGYEINWQTAENDRPEQQPTRKPKQTDNQTTNKTNQNHEHKTVSTQNPVVNHDNSKTKTAQSQQPDQNNATPQNATPQAVAWLSNLFAPTPQAVTSDSLNNQTVTQALESLVNSGAQSLGAMGQINPNAFNNINNVASSPATNHTNATNKQDNLEKKHHKHQKNKSQPKHHNRKKDHRQTHDLDDKAHLKESQANTPNNHDNKQKREPNSQRESRGEFTRHETLTAQAVSKDTPSSSQPKQEQKQDKQNKEKLTEKTANNKSDANSDKSNLDKVNFDKKDTKSSPVVDNSQHQNPDEVKVHVNRADINDKPTQTIHLSLDDDAKLNDNKNNQPSHDKHDDRQSAQANKADTGTDNNVQNLTDTPATEPNKHNDNQTRQQSVDADDNVITDDATNVNVSDDWHALFANRYVTAKKYGKANNDPRIVMANVKKSVKNHHHDHVNAINQITGSVGQFIHHLLPDAQNQIAKDGVIACFIKAVETYHNLKSQPTDNTDNSHAKNDIGFDFSNYGYQPLTTDYLSDFVNGITPIAHHQCVQGKTDVPPAPLKPRASNDPRGAHDAKPTDEKTDSQSEAQTNAPNRAEQGKTEEANKAETAKAQPSKAEPSKAEQTTSASDTLQEQTIDTLEKYKNMIESVAEQMLPKETRMILSSIPVSTGMIPKNRKRKQATAPKTDNDTANQPNVNSNANSDKDTENK